jgi:ArsR family transcriptional regulator
MPSMTKTELPVVEAELPIASCAPLSEASISVDQADAAATLFKALADPNRVLILNRLLADDDAVCVCELNEGLELAQPTVSFHLKKLVGAGLLAREQRGTWAYYSVVPEAMDQLSRLFKVKETV